jgi:hypothetical protein
MRFTLSKEGYTMEKLKSLLREPALIIDIVETGVLMLLAFGVGLRGDQQTYIIAFAVAGLGLLKALIVKPFSVVVLTDFGRAALALMASFGVGLTADQIAMAVTMLGLITTLIMSTRTTPRYDPAPLVPAGPNSAAQLPLNPEYRT